MAFNILKAGKHAQFDIVRPSKARIKRILCGYLKSTHKNLNNAFISG